MPAKNKTKNVDPAFAPPEQYDEGADKLSNWEYDKADGPATEEIEKVEKTGEYVGLNSFGGAKAKGKTTTKEIWTSLLVTGEASVPLSSELAVLRKAETDYSKERMLTAAKNRISQRLTQPYQKAYPNDGMGRGVFNFETQGKGAAARLLITYVDEKRTAPLLTPSGKCSMIGSIAKELISQGAELHACAGDISVLE